MYISPLPSAEYRADTESTNSKHIKPTVAACLFGSSFNIQDHKVLFHCTPSCAFLPVEFELEDSRIDKLDGTFLILTSQNGHSTTSSLEKCISQVCAAED